MKLRIALIFSSVPLVVAVCLGQGNGPSTRPTPESGSPWNVGILIRGADDLLEWAASDSRACTLASMIDLDGVRFELTETDRVIRRYREDAGIRLGSGHFIYDGQIDDHVRGTQFFYDYHSGKLQFASGQRGEQQLHGTYEEPSVRGAFDNATRHLYMFGGMPENRADWYEAIWAAHNSLPQAHGGPPTGVSRHGVLRFDAGRYSVSGTLYFTKGEWWIGPEGYNRTWIVASDQFAGDKTENPYKTDPYILPDALQEFPQGTNHYLVNTHRKNNSVYNSNFASGMRGITFENNGRAWGLRLGLSEPSSLEGVWVRDALYSGIRFADGTNNTSIRDCAVQNSHKLMTAQQAFDTKSTAFFLEGGNNHLTFINCKVNNFAYGMRNKGRRSRSITLIGCGHEQVGLLFQVRGEAHNFTWIGCNLYQGHFGPLTDRVAEYYATGRFASHERGPIFWSGCVNGENDAIYYQNKKYNLRGQPYPAGHSSETPGRKTASVQLMD